MGAAKLLKMGKKYAVLKTPSENFLNDYSIVDLVSFKTIENDNGADSPWYINMTFDALENGDQGPWDFTPVGHLSWDESELPAKVKKAHNALVTPTAAKPIGSNAPSITDVVNKGAYKVVKLDDGTYATFIPSTGESKFGFSSLSGASRSGSIAAKKSAAAKLSAMGVDPGSDAVETLLGAYEGRMRAMYEQAVQEMMEKRLAAYEKFLDKDALQRAKVASGEMSEEQYKRWLSGQNATQQWYRDMVDGLSADLVYADERAMQMLNGYIPEAYAVNMNYGTFQIEQAAHIDTGFTLYNQNAVARLIADPETQLLPEFPDPKIDPVKDLQWSRQKISSSVTQSILQGESVPMAAQRLRGVVGMSANSAMRAARTALTGAQNAGRADAGRRAAAMGIELKKQWVATVDGRTRYSHREIDRETVELDQKFSNGCEFPGDPTAAGHEVYNCRCAMRHVMPGYEYDDLPEYTKEGIAYEEWKNERLTKTDAQLGTLKEQLAQLEAEQTQLLSSMPENKTFHGIWKNDVSLSDWEAKKDSISAKEDYYLQQIIGAKGAYNEEHIVSVAKQHLADLHEFSVKGESYAQANAAVSGQLEALQERKKKLKAKIAEAGGADAYSEERKAAALKWKSKKDADDVLRHYTSDAWLASTKAQRSAAYGYTSGSGKYNRPLSGFEGGWGPYNYKGVGNVDLDYEGGKKKIQEMTRIVERSTFDEDIWLRRGCGSNAMDSFFGLDFGSLDRMSDEELAGLVGHSSRIMGFVSCGTTSGAGFMDKVDMEIFVPSGTQALYAEPFSAYTGASYKGRDWDGLKGQDYFGHEDETIIQRGASYTCTKIERKRGHYKVELEVHPEDGYDLFGQED